jgi:VanZ family protein
MTLIFYFSAQPDLPGAPDPFWDMVLKKLGHMAGYAVLLILLWQALGSTELRLAWVLTVLYAVTDEFHQTLVPGRHGTHWDVLVDAGGALMGTLAGWAARRWLS